uniref:Uncharacterized protein n=1 Tax=viral metagenome TaxID=1070528 RepID=A0A6H1ZYN0_9ZZZZ
MGTASRTLNGRDERGRLLPGHSLFGKSNGIKNGRKKTLGGEVRDALAIAEDAMPDILKAMIETATGRDNAPANVRQAAREYLIDRIYGKANQPLVGRNEADPIRIIYELYKEENAVQRP